MYNSEEHSRQLFESCGASYSLDLVKGADHRLDHIEEALEQPEGLSIAQKAAQFFGLAGSSR